MLRDIIAGHRTTDGIPTDELIIAADRLEELQAALSETIKQRDQAREHYDRIQEKKHKTEMELKKAFGKIEVLSMDNDALTSDRDNAWSKAVDLKNERDEARFEVERLKQELTEAIKNRNIAREWQDVSAKQNHKLVMELKESTEAIAAIENEGNNHRAEIQRLTSLCNQMESKITQARDEVERLKQENRAARDEADLMKSDWELDKALAELKEAKDNARRHYNRIGVVETELKETRDEVERLKKALNETEQDFAKTLILRSRPEPSRLEIAAQLLAAVSSRRDKMDWDINFEIRRAIDHADALIAAAKEAQ